ncbi:MAG: hypothetical protein U0744_07525 [Gemmataceae bacterium]
MIRIKLFLPTVLTFGLLALGCGGPTSGRLKGKVEYKQEPVAGGLLYITMKEKGISDQTKITNGSFEFASDVPTGTYEVHVGQPLPEPGDPTKPRLATAAVKLPKKALDVTTSGIKVEVKPGVTATTIELKD